MRWIEATSFVSPKAIPQLADAADVFARIRKAPGVRYPVLVPNLKGYERARAAGADAIAVFTAASEAFTKRNINMTIDESLETFRDVVRAAKRDGMWVRGYVSTAFGSPFGDVVTPHVVVDVAVKLMEMGCDELSSATRSASAFRARSTRSFRCSRTAFRSTRSRCTSTTRAAPRSPTSTPRCSAASRSSTASAGGLGGCPYAPGATGNVGTEDVLYLLHAMGIETGVDLAKVRAASRFISGVVGPRADEQSLSSDGSRLDLVILSEVAQLSLSS